MSRQNRVTPLGEIVADNARGSLMGNRGCIHDANGNLGKRRWARKQWVTCLLEFRGRHREIMTPGKYTELFFLDEATAFAAGHRPCATCQRARYDEFLSAWRSAFGQEQSIKDVDNRLHRERAAVVGVERLSQINYSDIPYGCFFRLLGTNEILVRGEHENYLWSPNGYQRHSGPRFPSTARVTLVTPVCITRLLDAGYIQTRMSS